MLVSTLHGLKFCHRFHFGAYPISAATPSRLLSASKQHARKLAPREGSITFDTFYFGRLDAGFITYRLIITVRENENTLIFQAIR